VVEGKKFKPEGRAQNEGEKKGHHYSAPHGRRVLKEGGGTREKKEEPFLE